MPKLTEQKLWLLGAGGYVLVLTLAVVVTALQSDTPEQREEAQLQAGAEALRVRTAYLENCASCHGERGEGGTVGVDFTSAQAVATLSRKRMLAALKGKHGGQLETPLMADERRGFVDFIREYLMLPAPLDDAGAGRRIYSVTCSVCHGERGDGASWATNSLYPPPLDFAAAAAYMTRADMIAAVTFGKPGTAMMPFATQLSQDEIAATVDYIRIAFMSGDAAEAAEKPAAAAPAEESRNARAAAGASTAGAVAMNGNSAAGHALYALNCVECHGRAGDGNGPRAYFMVIKPADFTTSAFRTRMDRARLYSAIAKGVAGSPMPAWEKVLPDEKIADLAAYVYEAFVAPEAANSDGAPKWRMQGSKKN